MQKGLLTTGLFSLAALMLIGCGNGTKTARALDTKSIFAVAGDKLLIHIEDGNSSAPADGSDNTDNGTLTGLNKLPVASVKANGTSGYLMVHTGEPVLFTAEGSYDPDGSIAHYIWSDMDANILSTDANFTRTFYKPAVYEKTLTVVDDQNGAAQAHVCVLADITPEDIPLIAQAGPDIVTTADKAVTVTGHAVCKEGDFEYQWSEGEQILSEDATLGYLFGVGEHIVRFRVTDKATGMYAVDTLKITVLPSAHPQGK